MIEVFITAVQIHCKHIILTSCTGTDRLSSLLPNRRDSIPTIEVESLSRALKEAKLIAENADIILFSPAFASFGQYQNEYEHNDEFVRLVEEL